MSRHKNKHKSVKKVSKPKVVNNDGIELTKHHLTPKQRVKEDSIKHDRSVYADVRILKLWRDKHDYWHYFFHTLTLEEIIAVLQRIERLKYAN